MEAQSKLNGRGEYVLATGDAAANRLRILHNVYGPGARALLLRAGIRPGMKVVDLGCGVGMTTQLLAELVGPTGEVLGDETRRLYLGYGPEYGGLVPADC